MTGRQYSDDELRDASSTMVALVRAWNSNPDPETETEEIRVLLDNCDLRPVTKTLVGALRELMMQLAVLTRDKDPAAAVEEFLASLQARYRNEEIEGDSAG